MSWAGVVAVAGCFMLMIAAGPNAGVEAGFGEDEAVYPAAQPDRADGGAINLALASPRPVANSLPPIIVIDPGHGGHDEGARGFDLVEKEVALDIALRLERHLREYNLLTVLTRRSDVYVSLADRAAFANQYEHSIFVSIHANQYAEQAIEGVETCYASWKSSPDFPGDWISLDLTPPAPGPDPGKALAVSIQDSITGGLPVANRGIKERDLYVVTHVQSPAVLVECGFLSNELDARELKSEDYREKLAASLAKGIYDYQKAQQASAEKPAAEYATYSPPASSPAGKPAAPRPQAAAISSTGKGKASAHRAGPLHKHRNHLAKNNKSSISRKEAGT